MEDHSRPERERKFGVRRRRFDGSINEARRESMGNSGGGNGAGKRRQVTPGFARVASNLSSSPDFNFGDDRTDASATQMTASRGRIAPNRSNSPSSSSLSSASMPSKSRDKYQRNPRPIRPGESIIGSDESQRLEKNYKPPERQDSFLTGIVRSTEGRRMSTPVLSTRVPMMVTSVQTLEGASAPMPRRVPLPVAPVNGARRVPVNRYSTGHQQEANDDWKTTRRTNGSTQRMSVEKPRVAITPRRNQPRQMITSDEDDVCSSPQVTSALKRLTKLPMRLTRQTAQQRDHHLGQDGNPLSSPPHRPPSRRVLSLTSTRSLDESPPPRRRKSRRLTERDLPTDGTADMPIQLDSDSDGGSDAVRNNGTADVQNVSGESAESAKSQDFDLSEIEKASVFTMKGVRAWIGEFACTTDLFFGPKVLWICSIKSVTGKWPFDPQFGVVYSRVKQCCVYRAKGFPSEYLDGPVTKVMKRTSFIALEFPIPDPRNKPEWRVFFDNCSKEESKRYFVCVSRDGGNAIGILEDIFRKHIQSRDVVKVLQTISEVKPFVQTIIKHDDHYVITDPPLQDNTHEKTTRRPRAVKDDADATQLTYPLPPCNVDIVSITNQDIGRLQPEQYLNDNIIDYYFKRLLLEDYRINKPIQQNVLFLSSHFYSRLRAGTGSTPNEKLRAGYSNVSTWLTRSDFFNRSLIFVPINKDMHWSMAIIINPKIAGLGNEVDSAEDRAEDKGNEDGGSSPVSCIAHLDPLGNYHRQKPIVRHLQSFLRLEWESSTNKVPESESDRVAPPTPYDISKVKTVCVRAPTQRNSYDCGVFILKYAQVILRNYAKLLSVPHVDDLQAHPPSPSQTQAPPSPAAPVGGYDPSRVVAVERMDPISGLSLHSVSPSSPSSTVLRDVTSTSIASPSQTAMEQPRTTTPFVVPRQIINDKLQALIPSNAFDGKDVTAKRDELQVLLAEDKARYNAILEERPE